MPSTKTNAAFAAQQQVQRPSDYHFLLSRYPQQQPQQNRGLPHSIPAEMEGFLNSQLRFTFLPTPCPEESKQSRVWWIQDSATSITLVAFITVITGCWRGLTERGIESRDRA
ncbi:hypothetical protein K435DRAFT_879670 [Dendrothele bispora CBS 962.96]|uniref:Uncharacterized protein n=1 Tax=Dendrothele bispora (strain CBS 962.96) TaxID=1314807 RepID=A0A4S8KKV7_DENBC|nr:hypothetical protein K435DRAFT_879670 [Dendrothele bispora CBS 962.96]